jgi:Ca2+-binding RTX toxin-like protein
MIIHGTDAADVLTGTPGNDEISGRDGDDVLDGGAGDDTLMADRGNNTFRFGRNDGHDAIWSLHDQNPDGTSSRFNTLEFKDDVLASDVTVSRSNDQLVFTVKGNDTFTAASFFTFDDPKSPYNPLQRAVFADGTE